MTTTHDHSTATTPRRVLVVGATGGTGRAVVARLLAQGHHVTAFSRHASRLVAQDASSRGDELPGLTAVDGDVTDRRDVHAVVAGHDAVVVTLGITENPIRVRLLGPARTASDVRSRGTANVVRAMQDHDVRRLVVQSSYGVGASRDRLGLSDRLFFRLVLAPQIEDTEVQEQVVRDSALDWVLVQPVHLTDDADEGRDPFVSTTGETGVMRVARAAVARVLARAVTESGMDRETIAVSALPAA